MFQNTSGSKTLSGVGCEDARVVHQHIYRRIFLDQFAACNRSA